MSIISRFNKAVIATCAVIGWQSPFAEPSNPVPAPDPKGDGWGRYDGKYQHTSEPPRHRKPRRSSMKLARRLKFRTKPDLSFRTRKHRSNHVTR